MVGEMNGTTWRRIRRSKRGVQIRAGQGRGHRQEKLCRLGRGGKRLGGQVQRKKWQGGSKKGGRKTAQSDQTMGAVGGSRGKALGAGGLEQLG